MPSINGSSASSSREQGFWKPAARLSAVSMRLEALEIWLEAAPGPLLPQLLAALAHHGEPLRWSVTAVEPQGAAGAGSGHQSGRRRLRLEAIMLCS
ncbi:MULTISPECIES: hypothetical protein [unclassified Synechococcus]|uniref:hypothetical protein n=2 Tax=Synechococcus TaxID=1129 RepID=UPI0021A92403|nr:MULTISPECIES: hypothetical protein [unclassified Synechococcus]MCT0212310.1 hypothetical protein [Synechococcus sp. CS-1326]MCT0234277.1 hypothetical protein [Synechococcus sp. CS-1327]